MDNKKSEISLQEQILLKKKQEIEERKKAGQLNNIAKDKVKTETPHNVVPRMKPFFSRHKALLRSGYVFYSYL